VVAFVHEGVAAIDTEINTERLVTGEDVREVAVDFVGLLTPCRIASLLKQGTKLANSILNNGVSEFSD